MVCICGVCIVSFVARSTMYKTLSTHDDNISKISHGFKNSPEPVPAANLILVSACKGRGSDRRREIWESQLRC